MSEKPIEWPPCPFCGASEMAAEYSSAGTTLYCENGCHGSFTFPAFESEVEAMWKKYRRKGELVNAQKLDVCIEALTEVDDLVDERIGGNHAMFCRRAIAAAKEPLA